MKILFPFSNQIASLDQVFRPSVKENATLRVSIQNAKLYALEIE